MYLRDTSRKIKTTIQTKRSMGEYTPKQPPFGYVKSKTFIIIWKLILMQPRLFEEFTECIKMDLAVRLFAGL